MSKKKLLIVSPHFSTGGAPQVSVSKAKMLINDFDIEVVEHSFLAWQFVVQRNRMIEIVGENKFHTLHGTQDEKGSQLFDIITRFSPDYISMEEFPEFFMDINWANRIYSKINRKYVITETTHDSSFPVDNKQVMPDVFVFISAFTAMRYAHLNVKSVVIEYPVDTLSKNTSECRSKLGLRNDYKHVVIVGLFTPRKNQKYAFELAEKLIDYKIQFHFLGNQADNFKYYWLPLMESKPDNCIVWGERIDIDYFLQASDLFLFTSKGDRNNKELNPIVIKESSQYNELPKLLFNLDVYLNKYQDRDNFYYLTGDIDQDASKILLLTNPIKISQTMNDEIIIVGTYPNLKKRHELTIDCIYSLMSLNRKIMLVSHYPVSEELQNMVDYYIYDAHNPLIHHSYYTRFFNYMPQYDAEININGLKNSNQTLTVLTNLFTSFKAAKDLGFSKAFYITYDVEVDSRDLNVIEESFQSINPDTKAYLSTIKTPFGFGVQTTAMTFDIDYFINVFDDVRTADEFNARCEQLGCHNFLEDYMMKALVAKGNNMASVHEMPEDTFLVHSGLGVSSNSEYYSIIPVKGTENEYMFYFYTYNIDERIVHVSINTKTEKRKHVIEISKNREYKIPIAYDGHPIEVVMEFFDGNRIYKTEKYVMDEKNIAKYKQTGIFKYKTRPKIKLVHLQTTLELDKEIHSREQLQQVSDHGWAYVLHKNEPYAGLPPTYNCMRPDCVSLELFEEATIQSLGTALTPAHYGCYESFKTGILSEFDEDYDFIMVCEGDCKIEMDVADFVNKVEATCEKIVEHRIGIMSYGDKSTLEHGWFQSPMTMDIQSDVMYVTNHIIGLQSIMFPKAVRRWLFEKLRTHKWDGADMYFNSIFRDSEWRMGIVKSRYTSQFDGYSLIDKQEKKFI
jgi:glycosyltransferase involved in cell wall biosynthesis